MYFSGGNTKDSLDAVFASFISLWGHRHRAKFSKPFAAIASGISATELVQHDNHKLAGVEATLAGEVIFALLGEILFLDSLLPNFISVIGSTLVISRIVLHSVISALIDRRKLVSEFLSSFDAGKGKTIHD